MGGELSKEVQRTHQKVWIIQYWVWEPTEEELALPEQGQKELIWEQVNGSLKESETLSS